MSATATHDTGFQLRNNLIVVDARVNGQSVRVVLDLVNPPATVC